MAIVTASMIKDPYNKDHAWFQVIDDINDSNKDTIKSLVAVADVVKVGKLSNVMVDDKFNAESGPIILNINNYMSNMASKLGLNDTQKKNLIYKGKYWITNDFKNIRTSLLSEKEKITSVMQMEKVGKHEWIMFKALNKLGVNVLIITKDTEYISYADNPLVISYGTKCNILLNELDSNNTNIVTSTKSTQTYTNKEIYCLTKENVSLGALTNLIDNPENKVRVAISGISSDINTHMIAGQYRNKCDNKEKVFIYDRIPKPTVDETKKIYRLNRDNIDYIINTYANYIKCADKNDEEHLKKAFINIMKDNVEKEKLAASILVNRSINIICWINRYFANQLKYIIYYGAPEKTDEIFFNIIRNSDISIVILSPAVEIKGIIDGLEINQEKKESIFNLDLLTDGKASTLAYQASRRINETLYDGTALGLYKEGMIINCETIHMQCTYDEIFMWWNKDMYLRPGFKQDGSTVTIPVIFGVVRGIKDSLLEHEKAIRSLVCGKTVYYSGNEFSKLYENQQAERMRIKHLTDIYFTNVKDQLPFIERGKLRKDRIKAGKNYRYKFLDVDKQDFILNKIQELIDDSKFNIPAQYKTNKGQDEFYSTLLNITLNLDLEILRNIQWFNYTGPNPNVVVLNNTEDTLTEFDTLYLRFLNKLGFDIVIFVPTQYSSVEGYLAQTEYETYNVGRAEYDFKIDNVKVVNDMEYAQKEYNSSKNQNSNQKKGFFSRLFGN